MKEQKQGNRQQLYKEGDLCAFSGTRHFWKWMKGQDKSTRVRLALTIADAEGGKPGKRLKGTGGIYELELDTGPGYRLYYYQVEGPDFLLLTGGTKDSQKKDIAKAMEMRDAEEEERSGRKH
jgi:putative addiction module killer protein